MTTTVPDRITASSVAVMVGAGFEMLDRCVAEGIEAIESAEMAYVAVAIIHAKKLYKTHGSFEAYMDEVHGRSSSSAYRWVHFGEAILEAEGIEPATLMRSIPRAGGSKAERPKSQRQAESDQRRVKVPKYPPPPATSSSSEPVDAESREVPVPGTAFAFLLAVLAKMDPQTEAAGVSDEAYKTFMDWARSLQAHHQNKDTEVSSAGRALAAATTTHAGYPQEQVRTFFKKPLKGKK